MASKMEFISRQGALFVSQKDFQQNIKTYFKHSMVFISKRQRLGKLVKVAKQDVT